MPRRQFVLLLLFLCGLHVPALAQVTSQRLDGQVQAYARTGRFSGSVLVASGGRILLSKGYGLANREWNTPNTPETRFRIASITKPFTALGVLMLQQQGKLRVSDPVCTFFSSCPEGWRGVTLHHLLSHTSGIPNSIRRPEFVAALNRQSPSADERKLLDSAAPRFSPGARFSYANSGYILLGLIIEKVSGRTYIDFMREHVFGPLGMDGTGYDIPANVLPLRAMGYTKEGPDYLNASYRDLTFVHGAAGALYSTTLDLLKFDTALNSRCFLDDEGYASYYRPVTPGYAYGWDVEPRYGAELISHMGWIDGFHSLILRVPSKKMFVAILSNVTPSFCGRIAQELLRLVLGDPVDLPNFERPEQFPVDKLQRYTGSFEHSPDLKVDVRLAGNALEVRATGLAAYLLYPVSEASFIALDVDAGIEFNLGAGGAVTGLTLIQSGNRFPCVRR